MNIKTVSSGWIKTVFLYAVIAFMGYMTYTAVMKATGNQVMAILSLALFDGGAYAGYKMLTGDASGSHQRTTSKTILWVDFVLASGMVAGGLDLIAGLTIKTVILLSAAFNCWALYYYETHDPDFMAQSQDQDEADAQTDAARENRRNLYKKSMLRANAMINHQSRALGDLMALRAAAQLKYDMRLPMTDEEQKAWNEDVIEADAIPVLPDYAPAPVGFWDFLSRTFSREQHTTRQGTPSQQVEPLPSPLPQDGPTDQP